MHSMEPTTPYALGPCMHAVGRWLEAYPCTGICSWGVLKSSREKSFGKLDMRLVQRVKAYEAPTTTN
jgi:hypothetical protein